MGTTTIEWTATYNTDGSLQSKGKTWNPVTGCTKVSPGCDHCYAETIAERFRGVPGSAYEQGFDLKLWPARLALPSTWTKPQMVFVNSMSDLFHKDIPDDYILQVFDAMVESDKHIYQVLTKRPSRLANTSLLNKILEKYGQWPAHVWYGTTIESNAYVWRADQLRKVPAHTRFISAEPLLGELTNLSLDGIHWLIAGAESGRGARPMNEDWVRFLRDRCQGTGTAFFYKQKLVKGKKSPLPELDGRQWQEYPAMMKQPA
jgi:protein gp37